MVSTPWTRGMLPQVQRDYAPRGERARGRSLAESSQESKALSFPRAPTSEHAYPTRR